MCLNSNVFLLILFLSPFFGANAYALDKVKDSVVVLNDIRAGFPTGNFCSGFIVEHQSKQFLVTASHCFESNGRLNQTRIIQGYTPELLETHLLSKSPHKNGKADSIEKLEAQLEALDLESRTANEESLLQSEFVKTAKLGSPLILNKKIDLAIFGLPNDSGFKSIDLASQLSDFSTRSSMKLELYGHPGGQTLRTSSLCNSGENDPLEDDFIFNSSCLVSGGNSGGPISLPRGDKALGIVLSHDLKSDAIVFNRLNQNSSYFPAIARALLEKLNGNAEVGILSENRKYWMSLDGSVKLRLRLDFDGLTHSEEIDFYRITKLLKGLTRVKPNGDALSDYSMTIYKTAPVGRVPEGALFLSDSAEEVSHKLDLKLIFLFGK